MRHVAEVCVILEVKGVGERGRPRKNWKEVVDKDADDCTQSRVMVWIVVNGRK